MLTAFAIVTDGLVVSQFPPGSGPTKASFPMRNATMSAYSAPIAPTPI